MLGNESLWDVAGRSHAALTSASIPHAIVGGVAVCLHGYRRNTVDLDLLVPSGVEERIRSALEGAGFVWSAEQREFRSDSGIPVQFLVAGRRAGDDSEVLLPDPSESSTVTVIENLPVVTLARLIEAKLACGEGSVRRMHKDFADVVELIALHRLTGSFAKHLHKSLRPTFRKLVSQTNGE